MSVRIVGVYDSDAVSRETALECLDESRTRQEFKEESDINTIIRLFGIGENPFETGNWITDLDIVDATSDYQSAMNILVAARERFFTLPAEIRGRFQNDPGLFVNFVSDTKKNGEEMVRLGLADKIVAPPPSDTDRIVDAIKASGTGSS